LDRGLRARSGDGRESAGHAPVFVADPKADMIALMLRPQTGRFVGAMTIWSGIKEVHGAAKTVRALRAGGDDDSCV
jgi:hypothetical protein